MSVITDHEVNEVARQDTPDIIDSMNTETIEHGAMMTTVEDAKDNNDDAYAFVFLLYYYVPVRSENIRRSS